MTSNSISEEDGVKVEKGRKPRLQLKRTQFGIKVRVHKQDKYALRQFFDLLSDFDIDVVSKNEEFGKSGWISLPSHFRELIEPEFEIQVVPNMRMKRLKELKM